MSIALLCLLLAAQPAPARSGPPSHRKGARAARSPRTVLVVPFATREEAPDWAGLAVSEVIADAVVQQGKDNFVTFKQLDAVLRRRDLRLAEAAATGAAAVLARALGATDVIVGAATRSAGKYSVEARHLRAKTGEVLRSVRAEGPEAALPDLARQLALQLQLAAPDFVPMTADAAALELLAHCQLSVMGQPLGPRGRPSLDNETLHAAEESCGAALETDGTLGLAHASLALALAARDNLAEAREQVDAAQSGRFIPLAVLAESWIERRRGAPSAATAVLRKAIASHPGFLYAYGLLGEDRSEAGDAAGALKAFDRYLARAPANPWAMSRKARELSRLGRKEEAIGLTRAALSRDPGDPELTIELATRYMEAGKDGLAEEQLQLALTARPARPLAALRLGSLYLRGGKLPQAQDALERAVREATRRDEARTRAWAHAELARLFAASGKSAGMIAELKLARAEGLGRLPCAEEAFARWKDLPEMAELCAQVRPGTATAAAAAADDEGDDAVAVELE